jgi:hypothetical protein
MPDKHKSEWISKKIEKLAAEGYDDPKQRVAIALSMWKEKVKKLPVPKK